MTSVGAERVLVTICSGKEDSVLAGEVGEFRYSSLLRFDIS